MGFNVIAGDTSEERVTDGDEDTMDGFYPRALAGFIMVMTEEGDMIYLGDSVDKHLGIQQVRTAAHGLGNIRVMGLIPTGAIRMKMDALAVVSLCG